ncbi:MAG: hypothetical protein EBZ59_00275 [Planctomycetia bacterium]|nr:hypothetical protein [Planctomycetia bacterium]
MMPGVGSAGLRGCVMGSRGMRSGSPMPAPLLADVLRRLAIALAAGIDLRRAWAAEAGRVPAAWRPRMELVAHGLAEGEGLAEAMARAGGTFPPLVLGMVAVGDQTGHQAETLRELAGQIDRAVRGVRAVRRSLVGPSLQLACGLAVVGILILVAGLVHDGRGRPVDVLGLGLVGTEGLLTYLAILGGCLLAGAVAFRAAVADWRSHGVVRLLVDRIPVVGPASRAAEAATWCRAASLASSAGLSAGRLVALASSAARGVRIGPEWIEERLRAGATLAEALRASRRLPARVVEAVEVGELTGETAESLERLAGELDEEARLGFAAAARGAGTAVWAAVAALITIVIFRIFSFYLGAIQNAAGGP